MIGTIKQLIPKMLNLDENKIYEIKEYRERRSINANSYYWSLINQLSNKLNLGNEELHRKMLKEYGQVMIVPLTLKQNPEGYFKYFEKYKKGKINNVEVILYKVYKPSSEMNSKEFSILLDGLVQECREMDIPTLEDLKIKKMIEEMEKER